MPTTIVPSVGAGCVATQQGTGTTPGYSAIDLRRAFLEGAQEGVVAITTAEADGWMCVQRSAGANNQVEIKANVACARVQGDSVTQQGLYTVAPHSAVILETITAADATNPRIDQVILEVLDNVHDASGSSLARVRVLAGLATAAADLTNRLGAAALPGNALRLADLLIPANTGGTVTLSNTSIRDRRPWARGAYKSYAETVTRTTTVSVAEITATRSRVECSGVPVSLTFTSTLEHNTAGGYTTAALYVDGALVGGLTNLIRTRHTSAAHPQSVAVVVVYAPAAGSHMFGFGIGTNVGTTTMLPLGTTEQTTLVIEEVVRQQVANNSVTSG